MIGDWSPIVASIQAVMVVVLVFVLKVMFVIKDTVNGTKVDVGSLQAWTEGHEKQDDERYQEVIKRLNRQ